MDDVGKDIKYGVTIYETVVEYKGKSYEIVVAEDGTLVEKVLVIDDEEVELAKCPPPCRPPCGRTPRAGTIRDITRSTGIGQPTFEAEVEIKGKVYLIEVAESGSCSPSRSRPARSEDNGRPERPSRFSGPHRIESATFSSWIARWICPPTQACPDVLVPWLLSCMLIPCKVRRA